MLTILHQHIDAHGLHVITLSNTAEVVGTTAAKAAELASRIVSGTVQYGLARVNPPEGRAKRGE